VVNKLFRSENFAGAQTDCDGPNSSTRAVRFQIVDLQVYDPRSDSPMTMILMKRRWDDLASRSPLHTFARSSAEKEVTTARGCTASLGRPVKADGRLLGVS
jgi:hypothetical protein